MQTDKQAIKEENNAFTLTFVEGILGFESIAKYRLEPMEDGLPFLSLQAAESNTPCFTVCDPYFFLDDYQIDYDDAILAELKAENRETLRCVAILTVPEDFRNTTANLKSPIIFNLENGLAKQFVLDSLDYSIRHRLFSRELAG